MEILIFSFIFSWLRFISSYVCKKCTKSKQKSSTCTHFISILIPSLLQDRYIFDNNVHIKNKWHFHVIRLHFLQFWSTCTFYAALHFFTTPFLWELKVLSNEDVYFILCFYFWVIFTVIRQSDIESDRKQRLPEVSGWSWTGAVAVMRWNFTFQPRCYMNYLLWSSYKTQPAIKEETSETSS